MSVIFPTALLAAACLCAVAQGKYVAQGDCIHAESCEYTYSADLVSSMSGSQSQLFVSSNVEVWCDSVGKYNAKKAKQYCLNVKETSLSAGEDGNRLSEASSNAEKLLSGPFCFVQTEDGKIVSVRHGAKEMAEVVNFKKGIAAAFQANFKNTRVEVEEDTLSKHYSRYSYEEIAANHVIMHRMVDSASVIQYAASGWNGSPLKVQKTEDIEYKNGKLLSSAGMTTINMNGPVESVDYSRFQSTDETTLEGNYATFDSDFGSGGLMGAGKYSLRLQSCSEKSKSLLRRSVDQQGLLGISNLRAILQQDAGAASGEMKKLREKVPSIQKALDGLKRDMNDTATISALKRLLVLENQLGPLPGNKPAVSEVADYLQNEKDAEMRALLFSLLAAEGSLKSQEIILNAIKTTTDRKERNTLCVQLAFVRNVHPSIVDQIESLIASSKDTTDPLVLAYGALAASSPQLQSRIVQFLQDRVDKARDNVSALIHLVHSLGNTESSSAEKILLQLIAHEHSGVRLASVYALRYSIESEGVQDALLNGLRNQDDADFAVMVARALIAGAESKQESGATPIGSAPFRAILQHANNNTDLHAMIHYYLVLLGPKAPKEYLAILRTAVQKRGTSWNDNSDPMYDLVQDSATRSSDITNYPTNKAYIFAKSLGITDIKVDIAFGAFVGYGGSANPNYYKLYAKGLARGYAFGKTATAFDALLTSENKPGSNSVYNRLYINIVGKVLVDFTKEIPTCKTWSYPLYKSPEYLLLNSSNSVYVYVGSFSYSIVLNAKLEVSASLAGCANKCISLKGTLTPLVSATLVGSASTKLIEAVSASVDADGSFQYQLQPQLSANYQLLKGPAEFCLQLQHAWPTNSLNLKVKYQLRTINWCKGFMGLSYPCGFGWGDQKIWEAASKTWGLPKTDLSTIWSSCDPAKLVCPIIPSRRH